MSGKSGCSLKDPHSVFCSIRRSTMASSLYLKFEDHDQAWVVGGFEG